MANTNLVIVESAAKSKTITKYLNSSKELKSLGKFVVAASFGHVRDLKKEGLGIDVNKDFRADYVVIPDKQKVVDDLRKKAKDATTVYLASDPDREGESISMHLKEVLNLKKYNRITFTEITQKALEHAIKNPRQIDNDLVDAQEARRILDRLVGFKLSPLLWKKYTTNNQSSLSAGRVQSAVLHMIINKEGDINKHETRPYWTVSGNFNIAVGRQKDLLEDIKLYKGSTLYKADDMENVVKLFNGIKNIFSVLDVNNKLSRQSADLPFITSSMQQEAYSKLGMSLKRSMAVAQELYEGGHITYMRTDSFNMSDGFKETAKAYIDSVYGEDYYEGGKAKSKTKVVKGAQEAHECIRITDPTLLKIPGAGVDTQKLYDLIWKRTIASLMKPCIFDELHIKIVDKSPAFSAANELYFNSVFKKIKFNGWQAAYGVQNEKYNFDDYLQKDKYVVACKELNSRNVWTSPPQRFNESSIVKALESEGLGRPSTYSTIMSKLFERRYIIKSDVAGTEKASTHLSYEPSKKTIKRISEVTMVGSETSKILPTDIGKEIDGYLEEHFEYIVDSQFTSHMEGDLDDIAHSTKTRSDVLKTFWKMFDADVQREIDQHSKAKEKKIELQTENMEISVDGKKYVVRLAKFGPVIQYDDDTASQAKKYIPLKGYLGIVRKQYSEITEDDIRFLISLPKTLQKVKGKPAVLMLGPYGLYLKYDDKNFSMPKRLSKLILEGQPYDEDDVVKALEYIHKPKETDSENALKTKKTTKATTTKTTSKSKKTTKR